MSSSAPLPALAASAWATEPAYYQQVLQQMTQAFCVVQVLFEQDKPEQPVCDYRFLEVNEAYTRLTGFPQPVSLTAREFTPLAKDHWFTCISQVARSGQAQSFELPTHYLDQRWYEVLAQPAGPAGAHQVALFFTDITARKYAQQYQDFLLTLHEAVRPLVDPVAIEHTMTQVALDFFGADRCYYCELRAGEAIIRRDATRDPALPSVAGTYPLASFPLLQAAITAGKPFLVADVHTSPLVDEPLRQLCMQLEVIAFLNIPVLKHGQAVGELCLVQRTPRAWTAVEAAAATEVAEHTWAAVESARAQETLRALVTKYTLLFESMEQGFGIAQLLPYPLAGPAAIDVRWLEVNPAFERLTGLSAAWLQTATVRTLGVTSSPQWFHQYAQAQRSGEPAYFELYEPRVDAWFDVSVSPLGEPGLLGVLFRDSTARHQAQRQAQVAAVLEGQEEERRRIAESLHNGVGQLLYATKLRLEHLPLRADEPARLELSILLSEAIEQTRTASHELALPLLTDFGLPAAVEGICRQLSIPRLRWQCYVDLADAPLLPALLQQAVYRLVQGLAHNVAQHAQASEASVELTAVPGWLVLHLDDNGRGFDPATVQQGLGLQTLHSRVALLLGTVQLDAAPGQGTRIQVRLPLPSGEAPLHPID